MATPDYLICPISLEPMIDPVICSDGTTYERSYIEQWLEDHDTSPKTNQRLDNKKLIPNYSLKSCLSKTKAKQFSINATIVQSKESKRRQLDDKYSEDAKEELDTLTVQTVTSDKIVIHLNLARSTVMDAKRKLHSTTGIRPEQQRLIYNGKMLDDHLLLSSYSIQSDKVIHMVLRFLAGDNRNWA